MAESKVEVRVRELESVARATNVTVNNLDRDLQSLRTVDDKLRIEVVELRQELAVLRQRFEDHQNRAEAWERHRWGLGMLAAGAILSFLANLIVAFVER